ncbi:hypothetical protein QFZ41_000140 [Luteibacter sp. W1I16]|uniref:hypothetical protein n=1 Tax=Luteibacter sp. W1I16 TaxID=3373922 RepID=UPI003D2593E4
MSHEPQAIDSRHLVIVGIVMLVSTVTVLGVCFLIWRTWAASEPLPVQPVGQPRLQARPASDLAAFRRQQAAQDRWEWVDERHATARVPVERAMRLMTREPPR